MENLKGQVVAGIKFTLIEKGILFILGLIQLAVVVRYIDKSELGLMAIANSVLAFSTMFSELGISNSILHRQDTDQDQLSSIFWWQVALSLFFYSLLLLLAFPIASFYEAVTLRSVISILGLNIVISSFGQTYYSLLYRDLNFGTLSMIKVVVNLFSFISVILLSIWHYGIWALVIGTLIKGLVQTILLTQYGHQYFKLKWQFNFRKIYPHIQFGLYQTGERIVNLMNSQFDVLIIGKLLGEEVLGVYDVIKQLLSKVFRMVNSILTSVMLPVFAKIQQDIQKVSRLYLDQINYTASINFPIYLLIAFNTTALFSTILNPDWFNATNQWLVIYFCIYFLIYSLQNPLGTLLISRGLVKESFYYNLVVSLLLLPLLFWAAHGGILFILEMLVITQILRFWFSYYYLLRPFIYFNFFSLLTALFPPLVIAIISILPLYIMSNWLPLSLPIALVIETVLFLSAYLIISARWNTKFYQDMRHLLSSIL